MQVPRMHMVDLPADYKANNDPPGMWTGYRGRLPECVVFYPRLGFLGGMELNEGPEPLPIGEVMAAARRLAWERYDAAHAKGSGPWLKIEDFVAPLPEID
jgi:hypothetical protein